MTSSFDEVVEMCSSKSDHMGVAYVTGLSATSTCNRWIELVCLQD